MNEFQLPFWLTLITPFLSGAFGVGLTYGMLRAQIQDHDRRLAILEGCNPTHMTEARCGVRQTSCREGLKEDIGEIKSDVKDVRKYLNIRFDEISRFMGRMDRGNE